MGDLYYYKYSSSGPYLCRNWDFIMPALSNPGSEGSATTELVLTNDSSPVEGKTYYWTEESITGYKQTTDTVPDPRNDYYYFQSYIAGSGSKWL